MVFVLNFLNDKNSKGMACMKKNGYYIYKVLLEVIKAASFSSIAVIAYFIFSGVYPGILTAFSKEIFQAAEKILGNKVYQDIFFNLVIKLMFLYVIKNVLDMIIDAPRSCGIYTKVQYVLERNLSRKISKLPYMSFETAKTYDKIFQARKAISQKHFQKVFFSFLDIVSLSIGVFGIAMVLFTFSPIMFPILVISIIPQLISRILRGEEFYKLKNHQIAQLREANYIWRLFTERRSAKEIRTYNSQEFLIGKWNEIIRTIYNALTNFTKKEARSFFLWNLLQDFGLIVGIAMCCILLLTHHLELGEFVAGISAIITMQTMFQNILKKISILFVSLKFVANYYKIMEIKTNEGNYKLNKIQKITLKDVHFRYPTSNEFILKNINLSISLGETIVIVGENGSGKTTLSKIILGLYEPTEGEVQYNDIKNDIVFKDDIYKNMTVLSQDYTHFMFSVAENIFIAEPNMPINLYRVKSLLRYVGLEKYTEKSLVTMILGKEYGGTEISGGEWQRLAIARAMYKDADFLILDEPTSALDPLIESDILNKFVEVSEGNQTSIIISHRISLCPKADKVIVVKDGTLVGIGPHTELYLNNTYYKTLYDEQSKWYA